MLKKTPHNQFELTGELTFETVPVKYGQIQTLLHQQSADLIIDLSGVIRADSAGVAMVMEWVRLARQNDKHIEFLNAPDQMMSIIRMSGLENILPLNTGTDS